jgi:tetraacyldisaccharide 4'-kinase
MREKFRAWAEVLETFFLEVVFEERHDYKARLTRATLFGGSKIFQAIVKLRRWLYNVRLLRDKTLGVQVIAIGNLTVGGTGKTPVVEKFARELRDAGRNVAILSRGYRSKPPPVHVWLLNRRRRASCPTANRCCSIPKPPATNLICWRRTCVTSSCWWTKTA